MSRRFYKYATIFITLLIAILSGIAMLRIAGRNVPVDFIRSFLAVITLALASSLFVRTRHRRLAMLLWFIVGFPITCLTILAWVYYLTFKSSLSNSDLSAIVQTNYDEMIDYISIYFFNLSSLIVVVIIALLYVAQAFCCLQANKQTTVAKVQDLSKVKSSTHNRWLKIFLGHNNIKSLISAVFLTLFTLVLYSKFTPFENYIRVLADTRADVELMLNTLKILESSPKNPASKEHKGELYILVIGESLNRDNMESYNSGIANTPFLKKLAKSNQTLVFPNAYSAFVSTVPAVTNAFSQGNFRTGLTFPYGNNIVSLAKQAGITTYWISNQKKMGEYDTPIGAISSLADYSFFVDYDFISDRWKEQYPDEILLPYIQKTLEQLDSKQNNLLIIHLMGSHYVYKKRYPENYPVFDVAQPSLIGGLSKDQDFMDSTKYQDYESYLTSIKYNDYIIESIFNLVKDRADYQALIYFSDHGESLIWDTKTEREQNVNVPFGRHNIAQFDYTMARIPLIINFSQQFESRYPQTIEALKAHREMIFTNDTLYDFLLDFMQVKSIDINYEVSLASKNFKELDPNKVEIDEHHIIGQDPNFVAFTNARLPESERIMINDASSLFKAGFVLGKGYKNLNVSLCFKDGELYVKAVDSFDDSFFKLAEFLQVFPNASKVMVELDDSFIDELSTNDKQEVFQQIGYNLQDLRASLQQQLLFSCRNIELLNYLSSNLLNSSNSMTDDSQVIDLVWNAERIEELSVLDKLSSSVRYIELNESAFEQAKPIDLDGHQLIVSAPSLLVRDEDFASKFDKLVTKTSASLIVADFASPFD